MPSNFMGKKFVSKIPCHCPHKYNGIFFIKIRWLQEIDFAGNTLKFERLKIISEIKGNFKLDGNVLEIALRFETLIRIHLFKNQGQ